MERSVNHASGKVKCEGLGHVQKKVTVSLISSSTSLFLKDRGRGVLEGLI